MVDLIIFNIFSPLVSRMSLFVPEMQKMCGILTGEETTVLLNKMVNP